jgi:isocitrate lyase
VRPHSAGSQLLELSLSADGVKVVNVVFDAIHDRRGRSILSVRDQNTFDLGLRKKRLMTLVQLFLAYRYRADAVHFLTPTDDNAKQCEGMKARGIFKSVQSEIGEIIVAEVATARVKELAAADRAALQALIKG